VFDDEESTPAFYPCKLCLKGVLKDKMVEICSCKELHQRVSHPSCIQKITGIFRPLKCSSCNSTLRIPSGFSTEYSNGEEISIEEEEEEEEQEKEEEDEDSTKSTIIVGLCLALLFLGYVVAFPILFVWFAKKAVIEWSARENNYGIGTCNDKNFFCYIDYLMLIIIFIALAISFVISHFVTRKYYSSKYGNKPLHP
jgi:hypothetical protein